MNFYIGNSIEQLEENDENVELDDEMVEYLYSVKEAIPFLTFFKIDPYSDTVVEKENIIDIISMCEYVLNEQMLDDYDEKEEANKIISDLIVLGYSALNKEEKILVIGD